MYFFLLLDRRLNVVEVRQLPPPILYKPSEYRRLLEGILKSTSGMWRGGAEGKEWYLTAYTMDYF